MIIVMNKYSYFNLDFDTPLFVIWGKYVKHIDN